MEYLLYYIIISQKVKKRNTKQKELSKETSFLPLISIKNILYENKTQKAINDTVYHQLLKIRKEDDEYVYGKNDVFALIIIMRQMLQNEDFKNMTIELENVIQTLNYNLHTISINSVLNRMGFPLNWMDIAKIERSRDINE